VLMLFQVMCAIGVDMEPARSGSICYNSAHFGRLVIAP
jgi:hypothetical protein